MPFFFFFQVDSAAFSYLFFEIEGGTQIDMKTGNDEQCPHSLERGMQCIYPAEEGDQ